MNGKSLLFLFLVGGCAHKSTVSGSYVALFDVALDDKVNCHFLMKKGKTDLPTTLCHDAIQGWVTPLNDYKGQVWASAPLLTQSGNLISFLEKKGETQISVLISSDRGKYWDIYPGFSKKNSADKLKSVSVSKTGRLVATLEGRDHKNYEDQQSASMKSKFASVLKTAERYPEECFENLNAPPEAGIPGACLPGYMNRLLNQ